MKTAENLLKATRRFRKTPRGLLTNIYSKQVYRCRLKGLSPPNYTLKQLHEKFLDSKKFTFLFKNWIKSNYDKQLKPSVDRIDCKNPYTIRNIQLLTWAENRFKQRFELKRIRAKTVYCLEGELIIEIYCSVSEAVRKTGIHQGNISSCLNGSRITAGGYKWTYENPELLDAAS